MKSLWRHLQARELVFRASCLYLAGWISREDFRTAVNRAHAITEREPISGL